MTESLDVLLYDCTNSTLQALDADKVTKFCDAVNLDLDGASRAARLLGHKIQSPQEQESLNALCVADECIRSCGRKFQDEIGKFRFLNEIIKMVSPKYFGDKTAKKVKDKCIELLYRWSVELRHEPKVDEAYQMLKKQGIIEDDPVLVDPPLSHSESTNQNGETVEGAEGASTDKEKSSIFGDEDKSKLLAKLLRSKHPDDLQAANRLIKNMVKQDEEKQEKRSQRYMLLETVRNNVRLLNEMLDCYQMAGGSSSSDRDIIKELHQNIEAERPKLFKLASETEDKDSDGMSQILQVNDEVVQISLRYKEIITDGKSGDLDLLGGSNSTTESKTETASKSLEEQLAELALGGPSSAAAAPASETATPGTGSASDELFSVFQTTPVTLPTLTQPVSTAPSSGLDVFGSLTTAGSTSTQPSVKADPKHDILSLFSNTFKPTVSTTPVDLLSSPSTGDTSLLTLDTQTANPALATPLLPSADDASLFDLLGDGSSDDKPLYDSKKSALEDLDFLGKDLLDRTKPVQPVINHTQLVTQIRPSLNELKQTNIQTGLGVTSQPATPSPMSVEVQPLTNVHVQLQSIKPDSIPPLNVYNKNDIKLVIHFAQNKPRTDITTMVISIMSTRSEPIKSIVFQAAVPKSMKVKLQPPTTTELPAYNPILPPSAVTQVMLLANPNNERPKMKYKLTYTTLSGEVNDTGDITNFQA